MTATTADARIVPSSDEDSRLAAWLGRRSALWLILLLAVAALPGLYGLPPMDRDESRFAQASKQMLEGGDYVAISYQAEQRNKKPAGIHWLQAASVALFSSAEAKEIWAYRLPSFVGAIGAVLTLVLLARRLCDRPTAALAGFLLAGAALLQVESLLAKTDAVLLFAIVAAQLGLMEVWRRTAAGLAVGWSHPLLFWTATGFGILIKGPIAPLVVVLTLLALCVTERRWRWLAALRPLWGLPLLLAIALPWFVLITWFRDIPFIADAVSKDLFAKLLAGEESHGAPPGYYLLAHLIFFWPGALFALPAVIGAWRLRRSQPALRFGLAWLLPFWLLFELVPTKLPHYVLPAYPALALITAWAVVHALPRLAKRSVALLHWILGVCALASAATMIALPFVLDLGLLWQAVVAAGLVLAGMLGAVVLALRRRRIAALLWGGVGAAFWFAWLTSTYLPRLEPMFLAPRVVAMWERHRGADPPPLGSAGLREPSLVFLAGTDTRLALPTDLASWQAATPRGLALVSRELEPIYLLAALLRGQRPVPLDYVTGLNYAKGKFLYLTLYGRQE